MEQEWARRPASGLAGVAAGGPEQEARTPAPGPRGGLAWAWGGLLPCVADFVIVLRVNLRVLSFVEPSILQHTA